MVGTLLSKYFAPFQVVAIVLAMAVVPGAWWQLRRPGPYLALGMLLLGTLPILLWNQQNGWIGFTHLSERGGLHVAWKYNPNFLIDFVAAVGSLLNPVWFGLAAVALGVIVLQRRAPVEERFLAAFSVPIFLFYLGYTIRARVHPNWIAASVIPGMMAATLYWHRRWLGGRGRWFGGCGAGSCLGWWR